MQIEGKVREILRKTGWRQQELAERLHVSQSTVNRWLGGSEPEGHRRDMINALLEQLDSAEPIDEHLSSVPLVGRVGAGAVAHYYASADEGLGTVPAPDHATKDTVAVEIQGDSLGPLFEHWLVYYDEVRSPVTSDMIGRLCVVGLPDDRVLVKRIRRAKTQGLYHLESNNEPTIPDVEIVWAARVKQMMPRG